MTLIKIPPVAVRRWTRTLGRLRCVALLTSISSAIGLSALSAAPALALDLPSPIERYKRIVFLGDSITWAGGYIEEIEIGLAVRYPNTRFEVINLGLPSETVSGLSEPNHAGGAFPRPDLHERLGRILERAKPDLVVACYGMNDGIYHPLSAERFEAYKAGFRKLRTQTLNAKAHLVFITPPVFDSLPIRSSTLPAGRDSYPSGSSYEGYDSVLTEYARWLMRQKLSSTRFLDIHTPLRREIDERRKTERDFTMAPDGVHINAAGHHLIAREALSAWKLPIDAADKASPELKRLIHERHTLLRDAWLSDIGHKRPGMSKGLPLEEAKRKAEELTTRIQAGMGKPSP